MWRSGHSADEQHPARRDLPLTDGLHVKDRFAGVSMSGVPPRG
jgi:hypothetical protein